MMIQATSYLKAGGRKGGREGLNTETKGSLGAQLGGFLEYKRGAARFVR